MKIAIVTGASSGMGREFVRQLHGYCQVDEIWAVARREANLEALKEETPIPVRSVVLDLLQKESFAAFAQLLEAEKPDVKLLVNAAGFGKFGTYHKVPLEDDCKMIDLNCKALLVMTRLVLPYMKKGSVILNVCSIAAFVPTPRMSVYCSTKAYVFSFSKALREETKLSGVNVLAACPGPMDTEFLDVAGITGKSKLFASLPRVSPARMARMSLKKAFAGRAVYTDLLFFKLYRVLGKLQPHNWMMKMTTV
jgi:short-subunit dehydrogenase